MMRRILFLLTALVCGFAQAQMPHSFHSTTGLIGEWKLCGDTTTSGGGCVPSGNTSVYDSSGFGNNGIWGGTASGTTGWYSAGYNQASAGAFDGTDNQIDLGTSMNPLHGNGSSATLVAFFNLSSSAPSNSTYYVVEKGNDTTSSSYGIGFGWTGAIASSSIVAQCFNSAGSESWASASNIYTPGTWVFAAATYQGSTVTLYVNGASKAAASCSPLPVSTTNHMLLGATTRSSPYTYRFMGLIQDVCIYNRALSAVEVAGMYQAAVAMLDGSVTPPWDRQLLELRRA
jgi:hypothetical protein